jgi:phosphate transport system permease protein
MGRPRTLRVSKRWPVGDILFRTICQLAGLLVIALAIVTVAVLFRQSWLAIRILGPSFFWRTDWDPNADSYGALAFIYGTVATSFLAMLIAVPLGIGSAAFLAEIAPGWLRRGGSFLIELLAAIPSVVYGFWGLFFVAPTVQRFYDWLGGPNTGGCGILAAGMVLAIMVLPFVAAISYDVCRAVPRSQREASLALGATRWQTIWKVVLPYARPGIIGACFLALGRALGETMAVTMLIGNAPEIKLSLFAVGDSIASVIANQLNEANIDLQRSALVELGLVLLLVTLTVNCLARWLIWRVGRPKPPRWVLRRAPVAEAAVPQQPIRLTTTTMSRWVDRLMTNIMGLCLTITLIPLFMILSYIAYRGFGSLTWDFFTKTPVAPGDPGGGLGNALVGSAMLVALGTLLAVPVGILGAVYLAEYRTAPLVKTIRFIGELLGGVPSIVVGVFAYAVIVLPMGHFSGWAGSFALAILMLPIVLRSSEEALKIVPQSLRNASAALGASQWQTVVRITLPASLPAIITGVFLGIARIAGETAPLLLTAYNSLYWPRSPNEQTPSLPYYIFHYSRSSYLDWQRQAWAGALVLLFVVMTLNVGIRFLTGRRTIRAAQAD